MIRQAHAWWLARASERGANMVEYAMLIAFIALVVVSAVEYFGEATVGHFDDLNAEWATFDGAGAPPAP